MSHAPAVRRWAPAVTLAGLGLAAGLVLACDEPFLVDPAGGIEDVAIEAVGWPDTLTVIDSLMLHARVTLDGGVVPSPPVRWRTDGPARLVVDSTRLGDSMLVRAMLPGVITLTARLEGAPFSTEQVARQVTVLLAGITSQAEHPALVALDEERTVQARGLASDGGWVSGAGLEWSVLDPEIVSVTERADGDSATVRALAAGTARVVVSHPLCTGNCADTLHIAVDPRPAAIVLVSTHDVLRALGDTAEISASIEDANGHPIPGEEVVWTVDHDVVLEPLGGGRFRALTNGAAVVTATSSSDGSITAQLPLSVAQVIAAVPVAPSSVGLEEVGDTAQLIATPGDSNGVAVEGAEVVWSSSKESVATVTQAGLVEGAGIGLATVTAASDGVEGKAFVTVGGAPIGAAAAAVAAGGDHSCGVRADGVAICWGGGGDGQLGHGGFTSSHQPATVAMPDGVAFASISAGGAHTCAVTTIGDLYCWGRNGSGQIGDGSLTARASPTPIALGEPAAEVSAGLSHTCAVGTSGTAYCWGANDSGQLGTGDTGDRSTPTATDAPEGATFATVSAGGEHSCAVTVLGEAYCWGDGTWGKLGSGTSSTRNSPAPVQSAGQPFIRIAAGRSTSFGHTCALVESGTAYCWGSNSFGKLGDGTQNAVSAPRAVLMPAATSFAVLTAGEDHNCAVDQDGGAWCWGYDSEGQLGTVSVSGWEELPTAVDMPGGQRFDALAVGADHVCAVTTTGAVFCWGRNGGGQIGDGTTTNAGVPVEARLPLGVARVEIGPDGGQLDALGATLALSATAFDGSDQVLGMAEVTWSSLAEAIAVVDADGVVTAQANGSAEIVATSEGVADTVAVQVQQVVASIAVSPTRHTTYIGETLQFTAEAEDANGFAVDGVVLGWTTGNAAIATVDASGLVTGIGEGEAGVTASSGGAAGSGTVVVRPSVPGLTDAVIAFETDRDGDFDIYMMKEDGGDQTALTSGAGDDRHPAWSPDGGRIAFQSDRDGNWEIYVINVDGTGLTRLTNDPAADERPTWSPDGTLIAFESGRSGSEQIWAINQDGSSPVNLSGTAGGDEPNWSRDGTRIAFVAGAFSDLFVMNANGSGRTEITPFATDVSAPAWRPDGGRLTFTGDDVFDNTVNIYLIDPDGTDVQRLLNDAEVDGEPTWSADGTKILFQSLRDGFPVNRDVFVMNPDGTALTNLTNNPATDGAPCWKPTP